MSRKNRDKRAANREARAAWEAERRKRARQLRWGIPAGAIVLAIAIAVGVWLGGGDDDGGEDVASDPTTTVATDATTTTAAVSVAGKPCVAFADELPEGAPEVPVAVGPAPAQLVIEDLVVGDGAEVPAGATVTVDYIGVSCSTGKIFDESYSGGQPATFGLGSVIKGWTDGIPGMKVGGRRLLGIPADQAYGATGRPGIAPDEALWFVVELRDVQAA